MQNLYLNVVPEKLGAPPGSMIFSGEQKMSDVSLEIFCYNSDSIRHIRPSVPGEVADCLSDDTICWLNINGLHKPEIIAEIGNLFHISGLFLEDILNTSQRPKLEHGDGYLFSVQKMIRWNADDSCLTVEQISFIVGPNYLISFQETDGDVFDSLRTRLLAGKGRLRKSGSDYLLYALLDMLIDNYFLALEFVGENLDELEELALSSCDGDIPNRIQHIKHQMRLLRRSIWPLRDVVDELPRQSGELIGENMTPFFRDLHDHLVQIMETVDLYRENVAGLLDLHLSKLSTHMNETIRTLTIIATVFIPLTFVAGVYGMNFEFMPELSWRFGYPLTWLIFISLTCGMLAFFHRRKWL